MITPAAASSPGKLILMGEHAVVYRRPALAAAVDLRLKACLTPLSPAAGDGVVLDLPGLGRREETSWPELLAYARASRESWERYAREPGPAAFGRVRGEDPAHVVKVALGEAAEAAGPATPPPLALRVDSDLPVGSGFGSSAATAVAVVAAYLSWSGRWECHPERSEGSGWGTDLEATLRGLALEVERRQHGMPSGIDTETVLRGGLVWAEAAASGLSFSGLAARSPLLGKIRVHDTGRPREATGAVVAAVRARRDRDPAAFEETLYRMETATRGFRREAESEVEDAGRVLALIREYEACLEAIGVVPAGVRDLVRRVEAEGGAAKISGAGALSGETAGSILVYHPEAERPAGWAFLEPFPLHPVQLGAAGSRREAG